MFFSVFLSTKTLIFRQKIDIALQKIGSIRNNNGTFLTISSRGNITGFRPHLNIGMNSVLYLDDNLLCQQNLDIGMNSMLFSKDSLLRQQNHYIQKIQQTKIK